MIRPPFMARVAAGLAVTAVEETRRLPQNAVTWPMTSVSMVLQTTMRLQQSMTSLAIKGDRALAFLYPLEEQPGWAVFDEDATPERPTAAESTESTNGSPHRASSNAGRFALYSTLPPEKQNERPRNTATANSGGKPAKAADAPEIAQYIDYDALTLAQLRARLRSLSVDELTSLLDYENDNRARAPFLTMLNNRIVSASTK